VGHVIERVDQELKAWATEVLPGTEVSFEPPAAAPDADIGLCLIELADLPPARGHGRAPLQVRLGYLVTASADTASEAHRRLGELLFAAMDHPDYEVCFLEASWPYWLAAGVAPRPGFILTLPLRRERPVAPAPSVTEPLVLRRASITQLEGVVLGPGEVPISDAFVELTALNVATRSDGRGRFRFAAIPAGMTAQVRVLAKAREFSFSVDPSTSEPVALRLDLAKE
jgi:hypothetical protein